MAALIQMPPDDSAPRGEEMHLLEGPPPLDTENQPPAVPKAQRCKDIVGRCFGGLSVVTFLGSAASTAFYCSEDRTSSPCIISQNVFLGVIYSYLGTIGLLILLALVFVIYLGVTSLVQHLRARGPSLC